MISTEEMIQVEIQAERFRTENFDKISCFLNFDSPCAQRKICGAQTMPGNSETETKVETTTPTKVNKRKTSTPSDRNDIRKRPGVVFKFDERKVSIQGKLHFVSSTPLKKEELVTEKEASPAKSSELEESPGKERSPDKNNSESNTSDTTTTAKPTNKRKRRRKYY